MKKSRTTSMFVLTAFASACASGGGAASANGSAAAKAPAASAIVDAVPVACPPGTDSTAITRAVLKDRTLTENRFTNGLVTTMRRENYDQNAQRDIRIIVHVGPAGTVDRPVAMGGSSGNPPVDDEIKNIAKLMSFEPATKCTVKVGSPYGFVLQINNMRVSFEGGRLP